MLAAILSFLKLRRERSVTHVLPIPGPKFACHSSEARASNTRGRETQGVPPPNATTVFTGSSLEEAR